MAFKDSFKDFPIIRTERLVLGEFHVDDAPAVYRQMRQLPGNSGWADDGETQSLEHARRRIGHHNAAFKRKANIHWAIRKTRGQSLIGVCKLFEFEYQSKAEIGYWIGKRYWNNGIATEAVRSVVAFAFGMLELHRVYASTDVTNLASQRVLEKSGFETEGVLKKNSRRSGVWTDSAIFGILNPKSDKVE